MSCVANSATRVAAAVAMARMAACMALHISVEDVISQQLPQCHPKKEVKRRIAGTSINASCESDMVSTVFGLLVGL